jgi:hypothetical protein
VGADICRINISVSVVAIDSRNFFEIFNVNGRPIEKPGSIIQIVIGAGMPREALGRVWRRDSEVVFHV